MGKGGYGKGGSGGYYGYKGQKGLLFWVGDDDDELWERQNRGWSQQRRQDWRPEWVAMKNTELRALREAEECSARVLETGTELRTSEQRRLESETELATSEQRRLESQNELETCEQRRKHWKLKHYYAEKQCKAYREEVEAQECAKASESAEASEWRAKASESAAELSKPPSLPSRLRNFLLGFLVTLSCRHVRLLWALGSSAECHRQVPAYYEVDIIVISQTLPGASPATTNATTGHGAASDHLGRWAAETKRPKWAKGDGQTSAEETPAKHSG
ncbi:unnamed protein product [Symbiodinium sp. KB8]|nr:unnamed protein product [Symbiodinium sp. KB8]